MSKTVESIRKYFESTSNYPLLVVTPAEEYKNVIDAFAGLPNIKVSEYCLGPDKEPDTDKLYEDVSKKTGNMLLLGLGDFVEAKGSSAEKIILKYKDLVLQKNGRVVIILPEQMYNFAEKIMQSDIRVRTRIVLPKQKSLEPNYTDNQVVEGIKAYLDACERGERAHIVKTDRKLQNVELIDPKNAFAELKHRFSNEFGKLSRSAGTPTNWQKLLEETNQGEKTLRYFLESQEFGPLEQIFIEQSRQKTFESWLYFLYLKLYVDKKKYIGYVAAKAENQRDLFRMAKHAILDISVADKRFTKFYNERKMLLKDCEDVDMVDFVSSVIIKGDDRIAYLTDNTKIEKQKTIESICDGANIERLANSYPDLYKYRKDFQFEDSGYTQYFSEYKNCKVSNIIYEEFQEKVDSYAIYRPYNSLPSRESLLTGLDDGKTWLIFLDAMGVEYLAYIKEISHEQQLRINTKIARALLPTITAINRGFYDNWSAEQKVSIKDLDELKHEPSRGYDYNNSKLPIYLAEELEVIKDALKRAKIALSSGEYEKVIIASDHGASRLAVIAKNVFVDNNNCESKASGRYCVGQNLPSGVNLVTDADNAIIADYSRFRGSRAASVEVHGGATLEEVIVPIIELTLQEDKPQVYIENKIIEVGFKAIPTLTIKIVPDYENVSIVLEGKTYKAKRLGKSNYIIEMHNLKKGKYTIDVYEGQNKLASEEITIKSKGLSERDIF